METSTPGRLLRLALWMIRGTSSRSIRRLLDHFPTFDAAARIDRADLAARMELSPAVARRLHEPPGELLDWAEGVVADLLARGATFQLRGDPGAADFGRLADPPEALFLRGELGGAGRIGADGQPMAVAVVGSRKAHPSALRLARRVGFRLARAGYSVVSGGAFGVDAAAHRGALDAGGHTVAVLGSGVLLPLPRQNRRLFGEILEGGGALASELPPWENARPAFFPRRNRLIAGLARAVVVVRASQGSGSLHTAAAAKAIGRPIFVFADEDASNAGARILLKEGATAVGDEEELLAALRGEKPMGDDEGGGGESERILRELEGPPASVAELAARLSLPHERVAVLLARLCARGRVRFRGPGTFART